MKFKKGDRVKATAKYLRETGYVRLRGRIGVVTASMPEITQADFKCDDGLVRRYVAGTKGHYWRHVD